MTFDKSIILIGIILTTNGHLTTSALFDTTAPPSYGQSFTLPPGADKGCNTNNFTAVVSHLSQTCKTEYQGKPWGDMNTSDIIKELWKSYTNNGDACLDEVKGHLDKMNTTENCTEMMKDIADDIKGQTSATLEFFANMEQFKLDTEMCFTCISDYPFHGGAGWHSYEYGKGCNANNFSVVISHLSPTCKTEYQGKPWGDMNTSDIIKELWTSYNSSGGACLDEVKGHLDKMNTTENCTEMMKVIADDIKGQTSATLEFFAIMEQLKLDMEMCFTCISGSYPGSHYPFYGGAGWPSYEYGKGCNTNNFTAVVSHLSQTCKTEYQGKPWGDMNTSDIIKELWTSYNSSGGACLDEVKGHLDKMNTTENCTEMMRGIADDIKGQTSTTLELFANMEQLKLDMEMCFTCISGSYPGSHYPFYGDAGWPSYEYGKGCNTNNFTAVVSHLSQTCKTEYQGKPWGDMNTSDIIKELWKSYTNNGDACLDEVKGHLDKMNTTENCTEMMKDIADDIKGQSSLTLDLFAITKQLTLDTEMCFTCVKGYYDPYYRGSGNYFYDDVHCPFSAVVNATNAPSCNFGQDNNWDAYNTSDLIVALKGYSNSCIDELKAHLDKLNSTCYDDYRTTADEIKNKTAAEIQSYALQKAYELDNKGCLCGPQRKQDYDPYSKDYDPYNGGFGDHFHDDDHCPFSAVVNATNDPSCKFQQNTKWDAYNTSDLIVALKNYSDSCIDELKAHLDKLNSTCYDDYRTTADEIKNKTAAEIQSYALQKAHELDNKNCKCGSDRKQDMILAKTNMRILNKQFTAELRNNASEQYRTFTKNVTDQVNILFLGSGYSDSYYGCDVVDLRQGSIIVNIDLLFIDRSDLRDPATIEMFIKQSSHSYTLNGNMVIDLGEYVVEHDSITVDVIQFTLSELPEQPSLLGNDYYDPYHNLNYGGHGDYFHDDDHCPFSAVVNATNAPSCNFQQDTKWDTYNTSDLIVALKGYSDSCIDELKTHLDKLNSTCYNDYVTTADEIKSKPAAEIQSYALQKAHELDNKNCTCRMERKQDYYDTYHNLNYGGHGDYFHDDDHCPFSAVVNATNAPSCNFQQDTKWDTYNTSDLIVALKGYSDSCIDELRAHLDKLNSTCYNDYVTTADEIKSKTAAEIQSYALQKAHELDNKNCTCRMERKQDYYDPYQNLNYGGHGDYFHDDDHCPFSAVVNATNAPSCNFQQDTKWDTYNTSDLIVALKGYSDSCIDELKAHLDKLNSTCYNDYVTTADEIKSKTAAEIQSYALQKAHELDNKNCRCRMERKQDYYDPYHNLNYGGHGDYFHEDDHCPFSAVVNATNAPSCNFKQDTKWDTYNTSDLIVALKGYSDSCIDELRAHLDKLNSTCYNDYVTTADEIKSKTAAEIQSYALQKAHELDNKNCTCRMERKQDYYDPYHNLNYGGHGDYSHDDDDCPFSAVVNATNAPSCNFQQDTKWDTYNTSDLIVALKGYSDLCIDELKTHLDKLNTTCYNDYVTTADEIKSKTAADIQSYALQKARELDNKNCTCRMERKQDYYDPYHNLNYGGHGDYFHDDDHCPFSAVVNATNAPSCNFKQDTKWDTYNTSDLIVALKGYSDSCIDELRAHLDKLNSTCYNDYVTTADEIKSKTAAEIQSYALQKAHELDNKNCTCRMERKQDYYDPYHNLNHGVHGNYFHDDDHCPFSAVVNATNAPSCNFQQNTKWDAYNTSDLIVALKGYSDLCIDELKAHLDKLNSTCYNDYVTTADEIKSKTAAEIQSYALQKAHELDNKNCTCRMERTQDYYDPYQNLNYDGHGDYSHDGDHCPFSAVVNATNAPSCNFQQDTKWDTYNTSDLIVALKGYSDLCIDELKAHLDKLNSTCYSDYVTTADEIKSKTAAEIQTYALQKARELDNKNCTCGSGSLSRSQSGTATPTPITTTPTTMTTTTTLTSPSCQPMTCTFASTCTECGTSPCWAYDSTRDTICSSNMAGWTTRHQNAWNDIQRRRAALTNGGVVVKSYLAKCSNMLDLTERYATLSDDIKNAFFELVESNGDNKTISMDDIPVEMLVAIEENLLNTILSKMTNKEKLQFIMRAEDVRPTYRCDMREILKRGNLHWKSIYENAVDANEIGVGAMDVYLTSSTCSEYIDTTCHVPDVSKLLKYAPLCLADVISYCLYTWTDQSVLSALVDIKLMCEQYPDPNNMPQVILDLLEYIPDLFDVPPSCTSDLMDMTVACSTGSNLLLGCTEAQLQSLTITHVSASFRKQFRKVQFQLTTATVDTFDADQIKSFGATFEFTQIALLPPAELKTAVCNNGLLADLEDEGMIQHIEDILFDSGLTIDANCMEIMKPLSQVTTLTATAVMAKFAAGDYDDASFDDDVVGEIVDKIKSTVTTVTDLDDILEVAAFLPSDTLTSITGDFTSTQIQNLAGKFSSSSVPPAKKKAVLEKMLTSTGGLDAVLGSEMAEEVSITTITTASASQISFLSPTSTESVTLTSAQATASWELALSEYTVDADYVIKHGSMAGVVPKSTLTQMTFTSTAQQIQVLSTVADSGVVNSEMALYAAAETAALIQSDGADTIDLAQISGSVFMGMDSSTLASLPNPQTVISRLKNSDPSIYGIRQVKQWGITSYMKNQLSIGTGSSTVGQSVVAQLGNNTLLLEDTDFNDLSSDALTYAIARMKNRYVCRSVIKSCVQKYVSEVLLGNTIISADQLEELGSFAVELDHSLFSSTILQDAAQSIAQSLRLRHADRRSRRKNGFRNECDDDDNDDDETAFLSSESVFFASVIDAFTGQFNAVGRRRRSTSSLTCAQMQTVGSSGLTAMTTAQITAMADSDFTSCASLLGGVSGYSSDQETALANVAKRATVWGDPSTWSSSNIQQAGVIVQALTTTEIQSMTWTIDDVSRMGDFDGWDETKKVAIVSTWLSSAKSNDASTITASELQSLSHMTCGLSTAQISALTTYSSAADSVGQVTSCSEQQMVEFANLAKVIYTSNVASWSSVQIAAVGVHIGGLSQTEISTLTETQIDNISPAHITYMPSSAFSGLTVTQIGTLSTAQAQSTTSTQRSALSSEQLTALETVSGISYSSTTSENGAETVTVSVIGIIACIVVIFVNALYVST